ncbi:GspH/FimT family pseudopilin [Candidatus Nitrosacidococcus tergens]|uniref:Type II secretion system protein H n=1 Tax=Candidatus Nitrosacidococcus tergens TaxID=553981 RepID=A0A7G1Q8P1_9GAMM|nr:GspH/FimT family pseudopilin [Candidatus Nitrosacidococcus tergens]CAB1275143.1 putative Fimbrial protein pilin [Candidatus Nitrosacidococcus tergens]
MTYQYSYYIKDSGFTFPEILTVMIVTAVLVGTAAPAFNQLSDLKRLESAAEKLYADMQYARTTAFNQNTSVGIFVQSDGSTNWCYGLAQKLISTTTCDCTIISAGTNFCTLDGDNPYIINSTDFKGISITNASPQSFSFTPQRGTAGTVRVQFQSKYNEILQARVASGGRIRICSPSGSGNVKGYATC